MKKILFTLVMLFAITAYGQRDYSVAFEHPKNDTYQLTFEVDNWSLQTVTYNGISYEQIVFSQSTVTEEKGWAELPFISASVQLPPQKDIDLNIVYSDYQDIPLNRPLLPSRGVIYRNQNPEEIPYQIDPQSIVDRFYPETLAYSEEPFIIRDVRGTSVCVFPFQWNSAQQILRVYTAVTVELVENNNPPTNPLLKVNNTPIREAIGMYESIFINFEKTRYDLPMAEYGEILVITTERDSETIESYIQWKKERGYTVHKEIVATGYTAAQTKSLIQEKYNENNNIFYVQIIGDWAEIKSELGAGANKPCDPKLGCVVGTDNFPDISIGRFSCSNVQELLVQINKAIEYEKNPNMDPDWRESFLALAGNETGGDDGEADYVHIGRIYSQRLQPFTYNTIYQNYQPSATAANVTNYLNTGASTLAYCAHGDIDGFYFNYGFSYTNSQVNQLTNGDKLPFITACACNTGEFNISGNCFAETWLKKENGGAVVVWMSSISQPWQPPMRGQDYFYDILIGGFDYSQYSGQNGITTTEQRTTWGSIVVNAANLMLSESSSSSDINTVQSWHTFGDASLQLRTKQPDIIAFSNNEILSGISYETIITSNGNPVENALVCISQDDVYIKGFTDVEGYISLENPFIEGEVLLVVTAFNTTTIYEAITVGTIELPAPHNLQFTITNANHIELTWETPEEEITKGLEFTGYNIYRDDVLINQEPIRIGNFIDVVPQNGIYVYKVTALYEELESDESDPVTVTIDGMCVPIGDKIAIEQKDGHNILVSWNAPEYEGLELAGYNIFRDEIQINTEIIPATELSFFDENLDPEVQFCYQVEVVYNDCEEKMKSEKECLLVVSINESSENEMVRIFPNPAHSELTLSSNVVPKNIVMYNITGQQVYSNDNCNKTTKISLAAFNPGIYFLKINSEQGTVTKKVIIN